MKRLVNLVGTGIGLATEAVAARKSSSPSTEANSSTADAPSHATAPADNRGGHDDLEDSDESAVENDETDWNLDDAAVEYAGAEASSSKNSEPGVGVGELVQSFVTDHPPPSRTAASGRLPCPVIIPQRRPQNNSRGFVRAYAPVLSDCGIDQATFLDFLDCFDQASK
ncbi:MAG: hypothetical protein M1830_006948, partial [Pleopsidium flavum]